VVILLNCKIDIEQDGKLDRTLIIVKEEQWPSGKKFIVTTIRNSKITSKAEPNLATAFHTVAGIIDTFE
jgi:hypothetical protein